jgi:hypothetical protein
VQGCCFILINLPAFASDLIEPTRTLGCTFFIAVAAAIFIEVLKTCPAFSSISILPAVMIIAASLYGSVIYRLQLSAIERHDR